MSSQIENQKIGLVDSLIGAMHHIDIDQHIDQLLTISNIVQNIVLINKSDSLELKSVIQQLKDEGKVIEHNNTLELLPQSYSEKESMLTPAIQQYVIQTITGSDIEADETENSAVLNLHSLIKNTNFTSQTTELLFEYLFRVKNDGITDNQRVRLFELLAEEYGIMLREKDIQSLAVLGQKTVMLIVTRIYDRIDEDDMLKQLPKGPMSHEIMRFFFVIKQLVHMHYRGY